MKTLTLVVLSAALLVTFGCGGPIVTDAATGIAPGDRATFTVHHGVEGRAMTITAITLDDLTYPLDNSESSTVFVLAPGEHSLNVTFNPLYRWPTERTDGAFMFSAVPGGYYHLHAEDRPGGIVLVVRSTGQENILGWHPIRPKVPAPPIVTP